MTNREQMNIVVVGHVDHGKSTVIGRLLADTDSLPQGKIDQVKAMCERNARPFEYAFLLDALKDEQAQGITIDTARCFFKTEKRDYIIIDAPGHVEFLKNMVSGAARAEAALLVIDVHEGIQENSRRHGYLMSMLGIKQLVVLVNKMDLIDYNETKYNAVVKEYQEFLVKLGVKPAAFVPISARNGDNLAALTDKILWYKGESVLGHIDSFKKQSEIDLKPLRFPVQDIYKFTENSDDRRIFAGTIETGNMAIGDEIMFLPSGKRSIITTIEGFNEASRNTVGAGNATGVTLKDELYIKRGEMMCLVKEIHPIVASRFKANIFWMGRAPLIKDKKYKLKIATTRAIVRLVEVVSCIDATNLSNTQGKQQVDRHDVAECIFETTKPIAFDKIGDIESTGRFVIVDNYDIAGGGIITGRDEIEQSWLGEHVHTREMLWDKGFVSQSDREAINGHKSKFLLLCGEKVSKDIAKKLERDLVTSGYKSYYLGLDTLKAGFDSDVVDSEDSRDEQIQHLGELSRILTDTGLIFISSIDNIDKQDFEILKKLNEPYELLTVYVGKKETMPFEMDLVIDGEDNVDNGTLAVKALLNSEQIIGDYSI